MHTMVYVAVRFSIVFVSTCYLTTCDRILLNEENQTFYTNLNLKDMGNDNPFFLLKQKKITSLICGKFYLNSKQLLYLNRTYHLSRYVSAEITHMFIQNYSHLL